MLQANKIVQDILCIFLTDYFQRQMHAVWRLPMGQYDSFRHVFK